MRFFRSFPLISEHFVAGGLEVLAASGGVLAGCRSPVRVPVGAGEPGYFLYCLISVAGGYAWWEEGGVRGFLVHEGHEGSE